MVQASKSVFIPVAPVPASRPKVSKFGTYYTATYANWRKAAAKFVRDHVNVVPEVAPLVVLVENIVPKPRTSKLKHPNGDVDNYAKAALDILNEAAWVDDKQIISLTSTKRFAGPAEIAGTRVTWSHHVDH